MPLAQEKLTGMGLDFNTGSNFKAFSFGVLYILLNAMNSLEDSSVFFNQHLEAGNNAVHSLLQ